jgi:hypothetical protein
MLHQGAFLLHSPIRGPYTIASQSNFAKVSQMTEARKGHSCVLGGLSVLVQIVNKHGVEFGITLLVQGRTISGTLTSNARFGKWVGELLKGVAVGKTRLPVVETPGLSKEEVEAVQQDWKDFERRVRERYTGEEAEDLLDQVYDQCCLRDVKVYGMTAVLKQVQVTERYPYLMVKLASVGAFTFGLYEVTQETKTTDG